MFTDGSRTDENNGCAVILSDNEYLFRLDGVCSVFFCEAYAIRSALEIIKDSMGCKYIIFSDSRSVLDSLQQEDSKQPIIQDISNITI